MSVVGFDVGNENSYIAAVKSGGIEILDNEYSSRSTPTYIGFTETSRDMGISAKAKLITNFENTVFGFKRILGKQLEDIETKSELDYLPYSMCELSSGKIGIEVKYLKNNVVFSIEQLMAMFLTKLKMIAEIKLNKIRDCVIAVPAYYTDAQRRAMLDAVSIAGLNALKLLNESTAVALSYGYFKSDLPEELYQNIVFVDVGDSSVTATACGFTKDSFKVLGCEWDCIGGRDFNNVLAQYFINDFKDRYHIDTSINKKAIFSLLLECESLKKMMSANSLELRFQIECFVKDQDVQGKMKQEFFENLSVHILNRIERVLCKLLDETKLNPKDIHSVELVGGSSRIPAVKNLIRKVFNQDPRSTLNQDEAIARGCALQCALLSPSLKTRKFSIDDMPSYVIKILWKNIQCVEENLEVFSRSDRLPSLKMITLNMCKPFTLIAYYVGPGTKKFKIGNFSFGNLPKAAEENEFINIQLKACLDIHGIFSLISAKVIVNECEVENKSSSDQDLREELMDVSSSQTEENISSDQDLNVKTSEIVKNHNLGSTPSIVVKSYNLSITTDVSILPKLKLEEFTKAEQQMINNDISEREKANARNALEEYIYDMRGKLLNEWKDFVRGEDKDDLLHSLIETQNWLYDNEAEEPEEYTKRLKDYQSIFEPINKRSLEWDERPVILNEYNNILQQSFDLINNIKNITKVPHILPEEVDSFYSLWQNSKQFRDQAIDSFSKMEKHHDIPITIEDLSKSLTNLKNAFNDIEAKFKAKEQPSFGDEKSKDSNNFPEKVQLDERTTNEQFIPE